MPQQAVKVKIFKELDPPVAPPARFPSRQATRDRAENSILDWILRARRGSTATALQSL